MIISCIGDSITAGDYGVFGKSGIANVHKENYPYFLAQNTGWEVRCYGYCGCTPSGVLARYQAGEIDVKGSDYILLMLGANGGLSGTDNTHENDCYRELIAMCKNGAPNAQIILLTPTHVTENPSFSNCGYIGNVVSGAAFTRLLSAETNLPLIETAEVPEFTPENEHIYQANDGLHFVEAGYKVLAKYIETELKKLID